MSKRSSFEVESSSVEPDHALAWSQARQRDVDWEKKDLLLVIYWLRQWVAVAAGIVFGLVPLTGLGAILFYLAINVGLLFVYYTKFLNVDDEDEKYGRFELISEGLWPSFALFLLTWIITFSLPY